VAEFSGPGTQARFAGIRRDYAQAVQAEEVSIEQGVVVQLEAKSVSVEQSAIAAIRAERTTMRDSAAAVLATKSAACDGTYVGVLAAPVVRGDVHTWFDLRTAFAVGLGLAVGSFALSLGKGMLRSLFR
tara:strand:+ start:437 stop:823 length:387 start_codon:yes stop_codon:yes gene_type:complete